MARSGVKFSTGGKLTDLGKSVKNITSRLNRFAQRTGSTVNTKDIRNQVRQMVEQGRSEQSIIDTLNKIRDNRLGELFVDKKSGELVGNISSLPLSPIDNLDFYLGLSDQTSTYMENELLRQWVYDMVNEYGEEDFADRLQRNADSINEAIETIVFGYLERGYYQGLDTALVRLYEAVGDEISWNMRQAISEGVDMYEWNRSYGYTDYDGEDY